MEQRIQDSRAYKFIRTQYSKEAPEAGELFPLLTDESYAKKPDEDNLEQDEFIFHQVTATLTAQNNAAPSQKN